MSINQTSLATLYPLNKTKNASAERRRLEPLDEAAEPLRASGMAPLLKKLLADYAASGLAPAYLPKKEDETYKKLLHLFSLKFNPFSPGVPLEALRKTPSLESFFWKFEQTLARDGGFALVSGEPGTGKSVVLRLLAERLSLQPELVTGVLSRPQANVADFYREMGDVFSVPLRPHNRWAGAKCLRERWQSHLETTLVRPVLLIDE